jgi:5'-phosphate synthase pdxT subunit
LTNRGRSDGGNRAKRKPTWGTCAGLILLAESANRTKKGGQELVGGLDIRVDRNHFGRQTESFAASVPLPFLDRSPDRPSAPFHAIFIRAPVVEKILPSVRGVQADEARREDTVVAPSRKAEAGRAESVARAPVEVLAALPVSLEHAKGGDVVAVRQGNCFGTSFHPELTNDARIHTWWLGQVLEACL